MAVGIAGSPGSGIRGEVPGQGVARRGAGAPHALAAEHLQDRRRVTVDIGTSTERLALRLLR